ncbi:hypothetical protein [Taibaiella helva]|uniref:hypothetical protein n=1 Tax=Taibaiella helva TaxID=2301235 RepID=UPI000E59784B|nr:hypothetical protein [Taibaiella helva]
MQDIRSTRCKRLLFNPWLLLSLAVLLLNDHYGKARYHNVLTGKLSDIAGLVLLPLLLAYLFPRLKHYAVLPAALFFICWKLPLSERFIAAYNRVALIPIERIVDYTDLWALLVLPFVFMLIARIQKKAEQQDATIKPAAAWILLPCMLALMATSPPKSYYFSKEKGLTIGKYYKIRMSNEQLLDTLRQRGFQVYSDSGYDRGNPWHVRNYEIRNVVLGAKDTLRLIRFALEPQGSNTRLYLNNVVPANLDLDDEAALKRYRGYYKKLLRSDWVKRIAH